MERNAMPADCTIAADKNSRHAALRDLVTLTPVRGRRPWWRRYRLARRLAGCFMAVTLAAGVVDFLNHGGTGADFIWVANGLLLAYLLLAPRWRWPAYLGAGFAALLAATLLTQYRLQPLDPVFAGLNCAEVLIGALLLRRRSAQLPRFTNRGYLLRFLAYAVVAAPLAVGLVFTALSPLWAHTTIFHAFLSWAAVDGLGTAVVTPAFVAVFQARFKSAANWRRNWIYPALLAGVTVAAFSQTEVPLLALTYPLLVLILLSLGLGWAALSTLFVATVGGCFTLASIGPLTTYKSAADAGLSLRLQSFVASAMLMLYTVSVVLEKQRTVERRLRKIVAQHSLVTENSRDIIILSDFEGRLSYVSPAAEIMTGWKPEELLKQGGTDLVHPDDLAAVKNALRGLGSRSEGATVECRVQAVDGEYIWVEASLRVVRDPETGLPSGILNMVRDIAERKRAEQQLENAYHAVEALAVMDALTGLANRRRFDQCLTAEWRRCLRDRKPLSMLLIDADLFKSYNDAYGHLRGDSCLKQIAEAALDVVTRPGDLVARFGGEEFAIILPSTGNEGAMQVALEICESLRRRKLIHSSSPFGIMTISVGCATLAPKLGEHATDLIEMADKALYHVKRSGRNHVCNANKMDQVKGKAQMEAVPDAAGGSAD
jgi:diguanylate cyclase (GGDEF)-like protein/PAS domain S-box-containing protein